MYEVEVDRVIDGDTFTSKMIDLGMGVAVTGDIRFRLIGVNTPERNMPGYQEATEYTKSKILGRKVLVETLKKDAFGRWLCIVYPPDEQISVNDSLLELRLAVKY